MAYSHGVCSQLPEGHDYHFNNAQGIIQVPTVSTETLVPMSFQQPATTNINQQPAITNQQQAATNVNQELVITNQQPVVSYQQPVATNINQELAITNQQPAVSYQQPAATNINQELAITKQQPAITNINWEPAITNHQPAISYQQPAATNITQQSTVNNIQVSLAETSGCKETTAGGYYYIKFEGNNSKRWDGKTISLLSDHIEDIYDPSELVSGFNVGHPRAVKK